ncbi:MAG: ATP-dependent zinc metalloprotease FtsH [Rikenellaceae bacterium]|jgi:cell division protease FtsH|nr:ATP-dependent zinc metalloprotease FtsH [Rikenellaceae bacterium]
MANQTPQPPSLPRPPQHPRKKGGTINILWIYALAAAAIIGWNFLGSSSSPVQSNWRDTEWLIDSGYVAKIEVINGKTAEVYLKKDSMRRAVELLSKVDAKRYKEMPAEAEQVQLVFNLGSLTISPVKNSEFVTKRGNTVDAEFRDRNSIWREVLGILPFLLLIGFFFLITRGMTRGAGGTGGVFNVGKAKAQMFDKDTQTHITFKDVAGLEEAKVEIMEIVDFLKRPEKYRDLGGKIPKGALLVGPPGTGKTLLAKAVAGEANVPFFSISGSDFVEMFVGVGASRVRDLFRQAKEKAPCIVFIDEIDAIGRARGRNVGYSSNDERENTLNQLLTEMDGFGTNAGVIILAATNRADILDKALMRAGRFDRQIEVGLPDIKEREEIFNVHLKNLKLNDKLDRSFLAKQTPGFSGADIANVCNEAALIAARNNKQSIDKEDFLSAIDRIVGGLERKNKIITPEEKRLIAYHEAGHATVSWILEHTHPLIKVTIIPRGKALGAAWYLPDERQITTREQLMEEIAATLGGRASEEIFFGKMSTGDLSDLEKATKTVYAMVTVYGMSALVGHRSYYDSTGQSDMSLTKPYSEQMAQDIDNETKKLIDEAYLMARRVIVAHRAGLEQLAERLLEKEVVFTEDMVEIFGERKAAASAWLALEAGGAAPAVIQAKEAKAGQAKAKGKWSKKTTAAPEREPSETAAAPTAQSVQQVQPELSAQPVQPKKRGRKPSVKVESATETVPAPAPVPARKHGRPARIKAETTETKAPAQKRVRRKKSE